MEKAKFLALLDELLEQSPGTLTADSPLGSYGWDSVAVIGFMALVDEHFSCTLEASQVAKCKTPHDLMQLLDSRII